MKKVIILITGIAAMFSAAGQCNFEVDETDDFTGDRIIKTESQITADDEEGSALGDCMVMESIKVVGDVVILNYTVVAPNSMARTLWSIDTENDIMFRLTDGKIITLNPVELTHGVTIDSEQKGFLIKAILSDDDISAFRSCEIEKIRVYFSGAYVNLYSFVPDKIKKDLDCIFMQ